MCTNRRVRNLVSCCIYRWVWFHVSCASYYNISDCDIRCLVHVQAGLTPSVLLHIQVIVTSGVLFVFRRVCHQASCEFEIKCLVPTQVTLRSRLPCIIIQANLTLCLVQKQMTLTSSVLLHMQISLISSVFCIYRRVWHEMSYAYASEFWR